MTKSIFVTVGSTQFNDLIEEVTKEYALEAFSSSGYQTLVLQIGKGSFVPEEGLRHGVNIEVFRYKDSLAEDFRKADLVISHAGAASCIEALESKSYLIAVVNESLMGNHQEEIAEALSKEGFCLWCHVQTFQATLDELQNTQLKPYIAGRPEKLVEYIDAMFV